VTPERVALTVGTTGALRVVLPEVARVPDGLWCYRVDRRRALLGGATSEGGNVYAWAQHALRLDSPVATEQALAALPPDGHGLMVLPFFAGERSPGYAGDARAAIAGVTLGTTPLEILRAALESVAYRFALIFERLEASDLGLVEDGTVQAAGRRPLAATVIASGGALLSSPVWLQIIADALGRQVVASGETEASCRGVALLALEALGVAANELPPAELGRVYAPDAARTAIYRAAIERQQRLYNLLIQP
jgi:gluconokinase